MTGNQVTRQLILVENAVLAPNALKEQVVLLASDGTPAMGFTFDTIPTGDDVLMTGYTTVAAGNVSASDDVNHAVGKVEAKVDGLTAGDLVLTGFVTGTDTTAVAATDNINEAIAKLQNRIAALETP